MVFMLAVANTSPGSPFSVTLFTVRVIYNLLFCTSRFHNKISGCEGWESREKVVFLQKHNVLIRNL